MFVQKIKNLTFYITNFDKTQGTCWKEIHFKKINTLILNLKEHYTKQSKQSELIFYKNRNMCKIIIPWKRWNSRLEGFSGPSQKLSVKWIFTYIPLWNDCTMCYLKRSMACIKVLIVNIKYCLCGLGFCTQYSKFHKFYLTFAQLARMLAFWKLDYINCQDNANAHRVAVRHLTVSVSYFVSFLLCLHVLL